MRFFACTTAATWTKEIPEVRFQLREDTGLSPAETVFGTPLVLPNEFVQAEEFSIDQIYIFQNPRCSCFFFA